MKGEALAAVESMLDNGTRLKIEDLEGQGWELVKITVDADGGAWVEMSQARPTRGFKGVVKS